MSAIARAKACAESVNPALDRGGQGCCGGFRGEGSTWEPTAVIGQRGAVCRLFDYDRRQPLQTTTQQTREEADGITVASISYASPKGGQVPALVVLPSGNGPFPVVIVQHCLPGTKEQLLPVGIDLARTGAVAVLIDAPFNRPQQGRVRSGPLTFTPKDRDEQIQPIIDLRRAVDLLVARHDG